MKSFFYTLAFYISFLSSVFGQEVVAVTLSGSYSKQEISSILNLPIVKSGVNYYKVDYTSKDAKGVKDTLSGLVAVPDNLSFTYPTLIYQHGTSNCKTCVPSRLGTDGGDEGLIGVLLSSLGFVSVMPDYVGMGDGRGFQTYVHAATNSIATEDMLVAVREWTSKNNISVNKQLFITGYSQGGYTSMAFHRYMQQKYGASSVTAAAHLSGPYSLSGVMRNLILGEEEYGHPAYVPNTIMGYNEVYEIYDNLSDFFKQEYVTDIQKYYDGQITLSDLNSRLAQLLKANTGATIGGRLIKDNIIAEIKSDPNHILNQILKDNDVYDWRPDSPTRIFYCKADDQVPYQNSIVARDTMLKNGALPSIFAVQDVNPSADHGECFAPAITSTILFFLSLQEITSNTDNIISDPIKIYPNPASNILHIEGMDCKNLIVWDMEGRQKIVMHDDIQHPIDVSQLKSGVYIITLIDQSDNVINKKIVISR